MTASLALALSANVSAGELFATASGENLFKAQDKANQLTAKKPSVENAFVYQVNAKAIEKTVTLNIGANLSVLAEQQSFKAGVLDTTVWHGKVISSNANGLKKAGSSEDSVTLVNNKGMITGTVRVDGRLFNIRPMKDGYHMVTQINENNMKPDHPLGAMEQLEAQLSEQLEAQSDLLSQSGQVSSNVDTRNVAPDISVLVAYTPGVASEVADVPGLVSLAFAETNQGYANSEVIASASLSHLTATSYNSVGISTDLGRLRSTSDGYMDDLHTLRAQYSSDIVMLLVPDSGSSCGQAAAIGASVSSAFAVTAQDCATGYYSFGHELGHLQSARHNPETDGTTTPFAYGHGYRDPNGQWRTVMAYNCSSGCTRINWWSNPDVLRSGTPMGTASVSDNSRVLTETAATVAAFGDNIQPPAGPTELTKGVAETGLSAATGEQLLFTFEVPSSATTVTFTMSGGSGDADLYTRFGATPTTSDYDCRPYANGNAETCTADPAQAGTYHAMINAYAGFSSLSLVADYTENGGGTGGSIDLTASGQKVKGIQHVDLSWSGNATNVDIFRDGNAVATNVGGAAYTDNLNQKGSASYSYQVCDTGTTTCSASQTVSF